MDPEFDAYFRRRVAYLRRAGPGSWPRRSWFPSRVEDERAAEAVAAALKAARTRADSLGLQMRGDAELLIAFLADELVARPLAYVSPEQIGELRDDLVLDVETIISEIAESSRATDGELSAHAFINGLSASWQDLRSGRYRLWDRHRDDEGNPPDGGALDPYPPGHDREQRAESGPGATA